MKPFMKPGKKHNTESKKKTEDIISHLPLMKIINVVVILKSQKKSVGASFANAFVRRGAYGYTAEGKMDAIRREFCRIYGNIKEGKKLNKMFLFMKCWRLILLVYMTLIKHQAWMMFT